jgi:hypothetical protein
MTDSPIHQRTVPPFVQEIADAFGQIAGVESVAWCGSAAVGAADGYSDFDFYVYTRAPLSLQAREQTIAKRATESQLDNMFWELEDEWIDSSSRRYNAMYRDCGHAMDEIHERLDRHSALLGYTTAYCFSIASGLILYDPNHWLNILQARLTESYPEQLTQSIIKKNRPVLGGGMQSCYLVQIKATIARNDLISLNHRIAVWIASYTDILFAVNRRYHPGEKRLLNYLADLATLPDNALEDINHLCALSGNLSSPAVQQISEM